MDWSIWSFSFATGRLPYDFVSGSPVSSNKGTVDIPMIVSLLRSTRNELILVDTGFSAGESMTGRNFRNFVRSDELLRRHGCDAASIVTIVLTHMHFDHAGNLRAFPNARIFLQRYEYESWRAVIDEFGADGVSKDHWAFSSLNVDDFVALEEARAQGRVVFVDGDHEVAEGVHCRLARDTHTFGSQWLDVQTSNGRFVLAGDCCYTYFNVERMWPPGYTQGNPWNMLREFRRFREIAGAGLARLVPGHDIEIFNRHRSGERDGSPFIEVNLAAGHQSLIG